MFNKTVKQAQYALLAHPAKHSLSPQIHNYGFKINRLNAVYFVIDTNASGAEVVQKIRALPLAGCNLSLPLKETVLPELDDISQRARLIGAVNTIKNQQGYLSGDNTDGEGMIADIEANHVDLKQESVLLLGGGATARAIMTALAFHHAATVTIVQRRSSRHWQQVQHLNEALTRKTTTAITCIDWQMLAQLNWSQFNLIINATSIGFGDKNTQSPLTRKQLQQLPMTAKVWDVVYEPRQSQLLQIATELNLEIHNGLGMLIQQAAGAFTYWTGESLPVTEIQSFLK